MIEEIQIFGVYVPAALVWAALAAFFATLLRPWVHRFPFHRINWHPGLLDLALFVVLWWSLTALADVHMLPAELPVR